MNAKYTAKFLIIFILLLIGLYLVLNTFFNSLIQTEELTQTEEPSSQIEENTIVDSVDEDNLPLIENVIPSSAIKGTKIVVSGQNLAGFEGDLSVVLERWDGEKILLLGNNSYENNEIIFDLKEPCQEGETVHGLYSGIPSECNYVEITPGTYKIYTEPWGNKSNEINFEVLIPTVVDTSKSDEIIYYEDKPVGYSNPQYSEIVGMDRDIGITMIIPSGVVPSLIKDKSLQEVSAYRFEDGLTGEYNDVFVIFSCFEAGIPKIKENIPYVDFSQKQEVNHVFINGIDYYHMQYDDYFMLSDTQYAGPFNSNWDIFGCGLYMVGKELSEVHISFLKNISYIESRDKFFKNIYDKFNELYVN